MKKVKTGLLALALVAGVSGAFVTKIHAAPKAFEQHYNWDGDGPLLSGQDPDKTVAEAEEDYGCSGSGDLCAVGTSTIPGGGSASIFQN